MTPPPLHVVPTGDVVRHAGGGPAGLAEEHCVPPLHQEQQTDHLVLAGMEDTHTHTHNVTFGLSLRHNFIWEKISALKFHSISVIYFLEIFV